ncbi:hypothetical protein TOPH_08623 [Tolypocladium ophioglossoides CBS 100239]|uniref:Uncharacterized protein n=1 Tax=Tolypocladium ophioglossoides (strain CBS 100239) TaxID=1163406 RepID=A0A0L0MY89_TOLOC|nr:hypothetical protein TOPH_08623 [Tolypocladium ophioglossoides CBS 100239]
MASTPSPTPSRGRRTQSTKAIGVGGKPRKPSTYDKNFEEHLVDHNVYPVGYDYDDFTDPEPRNLGSVHDGLLAARASLSPSSFSHSAFRDFRRKNNQAAFEGDVMATVVTTICGGRNIHNKQNVLFTELEPITNNEARSGTISICDLPSFPPSTPASPVAPNFFLEVKGPDGNAAVAPRQVCYDGAYGVRAMHDLQNFGKTAPAYDGNAYTYSATYHAGTGTLQLYAHHVTAPSTADGRPYYHMTQLDGWQMTGNIDSFRRGATAFRNARDMAKQHRDSFIQAANAKAAEAATMGQADVTGAYEETPAPHNMHEPVHGLDYGVWEDSGDTLQQQIADSSDCPRQGDADEAAIPRYLCAQDDSQNPSQESALLDCDDPSLSFASSFTSFNTEQLRPKRPRQSLSLPANSKRTQPCMSEG